MNRMIIIFAAVLLFLCSAVIAHAQDDNLPAVRKDKDGTIIVNTTTIASDVNGYLGPTPVEIFIKDGKITDIKALPNSETPKFFVRAVSVLENWKGLTPAAGLSKKVDAVSGATFSSQALIDNVRAGLENVKKK